MKNPRTVQKTSQQTAETMSMRGLPETGTREYGFWRASNQNDFPKNIN
ncbi:MAG: hypothetical protein UW64_C0019G0015 [Microgenomates group bacterium GW2011_GWC1_44_37]|uniref:Uncharacterized protein n=1 Tax=Candidatus Collierbacteria bacterium GW2011_GWB2_44_22 TaxID=1618387 RepID=A0A0G1HVC0_9BACT|nr:MAG: hypothetical protein UW31_C0018G0018 [Candidatus Collierbacteria bacterium GW2011_GWA2_44_13]KKT51066.1 MAG: hypothetical protein UW44_C0017G0016 [Candidatus Collierbacteria bacterium GW2011_GWB2_44_22]KKT62078.1 MAG: hypothetical protein UW56_C0012G0017 [Candidatus Collierbacteria bacterium GW2011_GWD1_44_27]KKT68438.1 MAG: hypothetical protein UW64_C0019G0015 [Microgenomates group bacterium GW2011_GWC1_44_37]KKT88044.1 MAG: hypothetical protein UW88_C0016G0009 [Candidatus Collierbacte